MMSRAAVGCRHLTPAFHLALAAPHRRRATVSTSAGMPRGGGRLDPSKSVVFVCDVQERFRGVVDGFSHCVHVGAVMMRAAAILHVPVIVTEQYPEKLGSTVDELQPHIPKDHPAVPKKLFSMCTPEVIARLDGMPGRTQAIIMGLEAHVCVMQTAMDLMDRGVEVFVLADGTSSQRPSDRAIAMRRLEQMGAWTTSSEMALFQMLKTADADAFKPVSALVREPRPEPPLALL